MRKSLLQIIACLFVTFMVHITESSNRAVAQVLINPTTWTGQGTSAAGASAFTTLPASVLPGAATVNVTQWNRDGALTNTTAGSCYNSSNWQLGGSLSAAITSNADVYFTITNSSTTELQVTQIYLMSQVSATGPTQAQMRYTIGAVSNNYGPLIITAHTASPENWTLNDTVCIGPGQTAAFRLYAWGGGNTAGTLRINNGTSITAYFANPVVPSATNNSPVCEGDSIKFMGSATGGVGPYTYSWAGPLSFSSTDSATFVTPASAGAAGTYTLTVTDALKCSTLAGTGTTVVTVNPLPAPIGGTLTVCQSGGTTTLSTTPTGGTWASGDVTKATIDASTGVVTGVAPGTVTISYTALTGCLRTGVITVDPLPSAITGTATVCVGLTTTLADATTGGTWSSGNTAVATIDASGVVTGVGGGTAVITYTAPTTCIATRVVTVNLFPSAITGSSTVCVGATATLSDATPGGTWSSSDATRAMVGASSGVVTGVASGNVTITYLIGAACRATFPMTVNPLPAAIGGTKVVCQASTTTLTDVSTGGTWSSSNTLVATVSSGGVVTGMAGGTVFITYTLPTTCYITAVVTVNPLPAAIGGSASVCLGSTVTLTNTSGGGTWSSSNTTIASIGASNGAVTGNTTGTATITYTLPTGCMITRTETVNPLPAAITGPDRVCGGGGTITLSDASTGGTWSSSNTAFATAGATTGVITGVSAGMVTITYTLPTSCIATMAVSVDPAPPAAVTATGDTNICPGAFSSLIANTGAGYLYQWFQDGVAIPGATTSSYLATDEAAYQVRITNSLACPAMSNAVHVNIDTPTASITPTGGSLSTCSGIPIVLNANTGTSLSYQWLQDGVPVTGAVGSSFTASTAGDYSVIVTNATGCSASATVAVTVNPSPSGTLLMSGPLTFCQGGSVTIMADADPSNTYQWYVGATPIGGATNSSYVATASGSYSVSITNGFGCNTVSGVINVNVNPLPSGAIVAGGPLVFCTGGSVVLTATTGAGFTYQWTKGGTAIPGATNASYTATTSGHYRVRVTNTATGCFDSTHADTVVAVISTPTIVALSSTAFCWGGSALLGTTVPSSATTVLYQWMLLGVPITGGTGATYNATTPGNYSVKVTVPGSCVTTTPDVAVTENPLPNPVVTYNASTHRLSTQSYFVSYQWYKDLMLIPGATTYNTLATGNGDYKVAVTDTNGCQSVAPAYPLTTWNGGGATSVAGANATDLHIYPNPAYDIVHIESPVPVHAVISSVDGKMIIDITNAQDIDISSLAPGLYILSVFDTDGYALTTEKLVKTGK